MALNVPGVELEMGPFGRLSVAGQGRAAQGYYCVALRQQTTVSLSQEVRVNVQTKKEKKRAIGISSSSAIAYKLCIGCYFIG